MSDKVDWLFQDKNIAPWERDEAVEIRKIAKEANNLGREFVAISSAVARLDLAFQALFEEGFEYYTTVGSRAVFKKIHWSKMGMS